MIATAAAAAILDRLADAVVVLDEDGTVTAAAGRGVAQLDWTAADLVGRSFLGLVHPDHAGPAARAIADLFERGPAGPVELRLARGDGSYAAVEVNAGDALDHPEVAGLVLTVRDITERRMAEWVRHQSEAEYRTIVELSREGLWTVDDHSRTTFVNPRMAQMLGYEPAEMIGRSLLDFMDDEGRILCVRNLERRRQGLVEDHDFKFIRKDGRAVWAMMATSPITAEDGSYAGALAVVTDITKRRATEHSLRMSEQRFRLAQEHAPIGLALVGLDGHWLQVNAALCDMLGRSEAELLSLTFQDVTHPDDLEADLEQARQLYDGVIRSYDLEKRYRRTDGSVVWARLIGSLVRDDDGEPLYFIAQILDVTEQRRSSERLTWMFERSPDLMCITDLEGRFLKANPTWTQLLGWQADELLGETVSSFLHPDDVGKLVGDDGAGPGGEDGATRVQTRFRGRDGGYRWLEWNSYTLHEEELVIANARDVTAQRWQQEELERQRRELARSNEELEHFAYVASHDLREPLRTITGFARLLEMDHADRLDESGLEYLRFLVDGTARMQRLIDDLLAYSRVGNETVRTDLDLDDVVGDVLVGLEPSIADTGARITVDPLPAVHANRTQMEVLVQNLVANALKFHRPDEPPDVRISGHRNGDGRCRLYVDDNGIGIPIDARERVFKMFQRLHTREEYPGTGIGLAMCKKITAANGGEILVDDSPQGGTRFVVSLPGVEQPPG